MKTRLGLLLGCFFWAGTGFAATTLQPWKDSEFGTPILDSASDCFATVYQYDEVKQVNGWDCSADSGGLSWIEVAKPERVSTEALKTARKPVTIPGHVDRDGKKTADVEAYESGDPKKASFAVIFIHGANGDRTLGSRDTNMGGNFNRLMNLVVRNNGVYYTPSTDFSDGGAGVQSIVEKLLKDRPGIKIVLACGSAGAATCHDVVNRKDSVPHLAGVMLTGGAGGLENITESEAYRKGVPMIIAHGSRDNVGQYVESFNQMRKRPDGTAYPVWMQVYNDGGHGTPIRAIDWKESLNWIFAQNDPSVRDIIQCLKEGSVPEPALKALLEVAAPIFFRKNTITCDQFVKYPFIKARDPSADYSAKNKSNCVAPRKETVPGEDLGIGKLQN